MSASIRSQRVRRVWLWGLALVLAVIGSLLAGPQVGTAHADPKSSPCSKLDGTPARKYCKDKKDGTPPEQPESACSLLKDKARALCEERSNGGSPDDGSGVGGGLTNGASHHVKDLANWLIQRIEGLVAPKDAWAPQTSDSALFSPFLWLGQHLAVMIFVCVVVVCGLSAWQGAPRLRQMGHSTGWTLVAVTGMASVPGGVEMLNKAVSAAFKAAFDSNESTLFAIIRRDLASGADSGNPLAILIIVSALCAALGAALLVFMTRNPGILVFTCVSPLVIASLARGGDTEAVQKWGQRLLGLMFAPMALLLTSPFVALAKGSLVMDAVILVAADVLMLRMVFHGVPYIGPRLARAARSAVESRTTNPLVRAAARAAAPDFHEQENSPRGPRLVSTPGRAMAQDGDVLFAAYGAKMRPRPGRLTTESAIGQINNDQERTQRLTEARRRARAAGSRTPPAGRNPAPSPRPAPAPPNSPPGPRPSGPNTP
ncbi:hypothetical protein [Streptomyces gilvosporeus]|uniref:hypothetical protein n=1 Tax=Streptomyces gilvosporeus TaxID=553510 RepID=UPI0034107B29